VTSIALTLQLVEYFYEYFISFVTA